MAKIPKCPCCNGTNVMPDFVRKSFKSRGVDPDKFGGCAFCHGEPMDRSPPRNTINPFTPERIDGFIDFILREYMEENECPGLAARVRELKNCTSDLANCTGDLAGFLEAIKKLARLNFEREGEVTTVFFLLSRKDDGALVLSEIPCSFGDDDEKEIVFKVVKGIIGSKTHGQVISYCFVSEAWISECKNGERPSKDPERREVLKVLAEERGRPHSTLYAMAEIKRHALSSKPTLGEWTAEGEIVNLSQSLFSNMFGGGDDDVAAFLVQAERETLN